MNFSDMRRDTEQLSDREMLCPSCEARTIFKVQRKWWIDREYIIGYIQHFTQTYKCEICGTVKKYMDKWNQWNWILGNCTICGKGTAINTPAVRSDSGALVCDRCSTYDAPDDVLFIGIDQHLDKAGKYKQEKQWITYRYHGHTIWWEEGRARSMWVRGGHAFRLNDDEKELNVLEIFNLMETVYDDGFRCTGCNQDFKGKPAGYPLFAGISCDACWKKHLEGLEEQRRTGNVCLLCGKPRGACYC